MDWRGKGIVVAVVIAVLTVITIQSNTIKSLRADRDKYKGNSESLLGDVVKYRTSDSLSAAKVESLELTVKEYQRFRAEDVATIQTLELKNRDLAAINKSQSQTIIELSTAARDTTIIRDSIPIPAVALHCGDAWFDFDGVLADGQFTGTLANRDSLILVESVKYKRFLGFLWKTRKIKDRELDVVSKNPHTEIQSIEHIHIDK